MSHLGFELVRFGENRWVAGGTSCRAWLFWLLVASFLLLWMPRGEVELLALFGLCFLCATF